MQKLFNNWSATLQAPLFASDVELVVETDKGAQLILGAGDFVDLTCDPLGAAPEIVRVVGAAGGVLSIGARGREGTPTPATWSAGTVVRCTITAGYAEPLQVRAVVGDAEPLPLAPVADPGVAAAASREDHQHPAPSPADIGAATAAQGAKADSAVQPAELASGLATKVDKLTGYGLSQENFTPAEKSKLAGLEGNHFKGLFTSLGALMTAFPSAEAGDYADVDAGEGSATARYLWDVSDAEWLASGSGAPLTAADIKLLYESNPDTNAFTDADEAKLDDIEAGAQVNYAAVDQAEAEAGSSTVLRSWTAQRVWQAIAAWWAASAMKTKLDGIAAGATANATDSALRDRSTHTGTQAASTISDLVEVTQDTVGAMIVAGANVSVSYNDTAGTLTVSAASGAASSPVSVISGTTYTGAASDNRKTLVFTNTAAKAATIDPEATTALPSDWELILNNKGASNLTVVAGSGVTISAPAGGSLVIPSGGTCALKRRGADDFFLAGNTL
ncbi:hypothetical protein [Pseudomonas sp. SO81]|uniref:hypothetical protein n=1 Tax=Pseudomonas sp. SO81 TaxID=2983246 RepID=UPI0025A43FB4|nr:hypothetical protein [Pseudomonas sp. SO81]WJN60942.1 hypothetical protein OH686_19530 [Pseudomonas sp. SO81]